MLAAWAGCASSAVTEVYRWQAQDGSAVYSDAPPPQGSDYTVRRIQTLPAQPAEADGAAAAPACERGAIGTLARSHRADVAEAEARLGRAREQLRAGQEPLPGERLANAGGGSRLGPAYFARQDLLEAQLRDAQAELRAARQRQLESAEQLAAAC